MEILNCQVKAYISTYKFYQQINIVNLQLHYLMVKIIEYYTLHQQIGEGQYGKVFRGIDSRNKKEVAVKVINVKKFKQYPKLEECTLNEIQVLSNINSPYIVKFIEILKTANNFYFFYEYCNQGTLEDVIKSKGTLSQNQALQYLSQLLSAFQILSSKHIMHRDLKPSNILMNNGTIKLADFGFCKSLESHRDLAQTMLGSPIYMAPQVLKGQIYTIKADIWSLGVVIYEMLYGFCPFQERSIARLINLLDKESVSFNQQINKITSDFEGLIKKMLVKDHFKRITWNEIFSYQINGKPIVPSERRNSINLTEYSNQKKQTPTSYFSRKEETFPIPFVKTISSQPEQRNQKKQENRYEQYRVEYDQPELREIKNYDNYQKEQAYLKPLTEFTNNYYSKSNENSAKKPQTIATKENIQPPVPSMFKKKNSTQNTLQINKQNTKTTEPVNEGDIVRGKIYHYIKLVDEIIKWNLCPEITPHLCLKVYTIIHKEHNKIYENLYTSQVISERNALIDAINIFREEANKSSFQVNGPLLTHYVKNFQTKTGTEISKDVINHYLSLLDLNDWSPTKINDYSGYGREKMNMQLHRKIIRNVI